MATAAVEKLNMTFMASLRDGDTVASGLKRPICPTVWAVVVSFSGMLGEGDSAPFFSTSATTWSIEGAPDGKVDGFLELRSMILALFVSFSFIQM